MSITIEAVYEGGVFRPRVPVELDEGTAVRIAITPATGAPEEDPLEAVIGIGEGAPDGAANHDKYIYGEAPRP